MVLANADGGRAEEIARRGGAGQGGVGRRIRAAGGREQAAFSTSKPEHSRPDSSGRGAAGDGSLEVGAEPVPGYRLIAFLGRGGFGEVWKALGPGGFAVALKFVRLADKGAAVEVRSLELMKALRHPQLVSVFGTWEADDRLIVAMELAERSLSDRLVEARGQGLAGLPFPELLE